MRWIFQICVWTLIFWQIWTQDIIFPTDEGTPHVSGNIGNPGGQKIEERLPVEIPGQCPENMLLYPGGGNTSSWICDCKAKFVYFPANNSCYEIYKRGPCPPKHIVILPPKEVIPKCSENPCLEENHVLFKGSCAKINTIGGKCGPKEILAVNETTFQLQCFPTDVDPFIIINAPPKVCPAGSRRNSLGICRCTL